MRVAHWVAGLLLASASALGQAPHEEWRTIETAHFRIHYPRTHEEWAQRAAGRIEAIRTRVTEAVGYAPPEIIDVIVSDPIAQPNGIAWPILGWPRMILWTNPPAPESVIGNYGDWAEVLIVHEQAHLAHLLRPSRNPLRLALTRVLPVSVVALRSPRWVTEGYATVLEGELTGRGRPNSALRAAIMRRWAQLGRLPSYGALNSDRNWLGMSMAYLAGSAYLEWLQERAGPDSLQKLWRRMSARADRDFESAFTGVFGESPARLYARFSAELTARSIEFEREVESIRNDGELWQDLSWTTEAPSVSSDGTKLATVIRHRDRPSRLVVFSTAPAAAEEKKWRERAEEILKNDPDDVIAVRAKPLARKPLYELETRNGAEPYGPRWLSDGSILFVRFEPSSDGMIRPDLFRWFPERRDVRRVTHEESVRDASPAPDGTWAAAVRNRFGKSQLVRVDLASGAISELTDASVDRVYDSPVVSPDGTKLAYVLQRDRAWRLVVRDLATGAVVEPDVGAAGVVAQPAWTHDGREILAVLDLSGFLEIYSLDPHAQREPRRITLSHSASFAPAPSPDGSIYFLALDVDGFDIRHLAGFPDSALLNPEPLTETVKPPPPFESASFPPSHEYSIGRQELAVLFGGSYAPAARHLEVGLRSGDVIGRLNAFAFASLAKERGVSGGAVAAAWRGFPIELSAHLYSASEEFVPDDDIDREGIELRARWNRIWRGGRLDLAGGSLLEGVDGVERELAFFEPAIRHGITFGLWSIASNASARVQIGSTDRDDWTRAGGRVDFAIEHDDQWIEFSFERESALGVETPFELLSIGGMRSTILPDGAVGARRFVPALPVGFRLGDRRETQRVAAETPLFPMTLFYERHRLWMHGEHRGEWLALVGAELVVPTVSDPILRMPGAEIRAGVSRFLSEAKHGQTEWWVGLVWRP